MKKYILVFLILFFSCDKKEIKKTLESNNTDSLNYFFKQADNNNLDIKSKLYFIEKSLKIISNFKNDSLKRKYYFKVANRYFNNNDFENYKKTNETILKLSLEEKDSINLAKAYTNLGEFYGLNLKSDSAYYFLFRAEKIYAIQKDLTKLSKTILNKAVLQQNEKDYVGSEKSVFLALKYLKTTTNSNLNYEAYNLLGIIYNELSEFDKSIEYHNKALEELKKNNSDRNIELKLMSLNNIGLIYQNKNEYQKSFFYFEEALKNKNILTQYTFTNAVLQTNLGYSQFKLNEQKNLPRIFYESLKTFEESNFVTGIINCKLNLTEYYTFKKDTAKAFTFANSSYQLAKSNNLPKDILLSLKQLSIVNPKKIADYSKEYIKISDSLQLSERKMRNKLARIEFETEELTVEKDNLVSKQRNTIFISLGMVLLLSIAFLIRFQIMKNKELMLKQEQQKANEEVYQLLLNQQNKIETVRQTEKKRIARELHDNILSKLFGTRMHLDMLNNEKEENEVKKRMVFIQGLKSIEREIREISHDLSSENTAVFNNFVAMVLQFIDNQKAVCNAEIVFKMDDDINWNLQENLLKINFYRILQESFQNINKHANATQVFVTFEISSVSITLDVIDNGIGFDYQKKKNGIGLRNMNSRTQDSNGAMTVVTKLGKGTTLNFDMPYYKI